MPKIVTPPAESGNQVVLKNGLYIFRVLDAIEKTDSGGNETIHLTQSVGGVTIPDTLIFEPTQYRRIHQFLMAAGRAMKPGDEIALSAKDCVGLTGLCSVFNVFHGGFVQNAIREYVPVNS